MPNIKLELSGSRIGDKRVPIEVLGKYLLGFNNLLLNISLATVKVPSKRKKRKQFFDDRQLFMIGLESGSAVAILTTHPQTTLDTFQTAILPVLNIAIDGFEKIQLSSEEEAYDEIREMYPESSSRVKVLNSYNDLLKIKDTDLTISSESLIKKRVQVKSSFQPRVRKWLDTELKISSETLKGVITGIKAYGKQRYFTLMDEKDSLIKCMYEEDLESEIINFFKTPVILKGIISEVRTSKKIKEIMEISKMKSILIYRIDYPPLIQSIELDIDYIADGDFYVAENEDLCLRATGDSIYNLKKELIQFLDLNVDMYLIDYYHDAPIPTPKLKKAIDILKTIIDLSKRPYKDHWEIVSEET